MSIEAKYQAMGGRTGTLGRARGELRRFRGGSLQGYRSGVIVRATGAQPVALHGELSELWTELGAERGALGLPVADQRSDGEGGERARFAHGSLAVHSVPGELKVFQQNMALLPKAFYKGTQRDKAIRRLERHLREQRPDVVGLSETFLRGERSRIARVFADVHGIVDMRGHRLDGPDEHDLEEDGGLLLLSRYPAVAHAHTIYRDAEGADGLANKGALHMRIRVPGHPADYDLFHTHTQNPNEGGRMEAWETVKAQLKHLGVFMRAQRSTQRPALLMGDLNTDGNHPAQHLALRRALGGKPVDLWQQESSSHSGITSDRRTSFRSGAPRRGPNHPQRDLEGTRLDMFLSYPGERVWPCYRETAPVLLQSSSGRDMSDHYGVRTQIDGLRVFDLKVRRAIDRVRVRLVEAHCLEATDELGDDDVYFDTRLVDADGESARVRSRMHRRVRTGDRLMFGSPRSLISRRPGALLRIQVTGREHDRHSDHDVLGTAQLSLRRDELLAMVGRGRHFALPILRGDGGEYAVTVQVDVFAG